MERGALLPVLCLALCIAAGVIGGEQFKVGDDQGWREPDPAHADMYALWAGRTNFHTGDSLYFSYSNDSVVAVDKRGYYHCNTTNATASFHDGKTVIRLHAAGLLYFISGAAGHCPNGQRLIVDVQPPAPAPSLSPIAAPPVPSPAPPPSPSPSLSPAPSSDGQPAQAPLPNSAYSQPATISAAAVGVNALVFIVRLTFL